MFLVFSYGQSAEKPIDSSPTGAETLVIERDQDVAEDVIAFSKNVLVRGIARRGVAAVGGNLVIEGIVRGDVVVIGGTLEIKDGAIVQQDVIVIGGNLRRDPLGRVDGKVFATSFYQQRLIEFFQNPSRVLFHVDYSPTSMLWRILRLSCWFVLSYLVFKLFSQPVLRAGRHLEQNPGRVVATGLIASVALATSLLLFLVLCVILIGVPLVIGWGVFTLGVWIFGSTAVYHVLGSAIARTFLARRVAPTPALLLFLGLLSVGLIRLLPVVNFVLPYFIFVLALGTTIQSYIRMDQLLFWKKSIPSLPCTDR